MHETKNYLTLHQAATLVPGETSANCIWRWCRKGVLARTGHRLRLQHVRIGGKLYTTAGWVSEFGQLLAEADANYFRIGDDSVIHQPSRQTDGQRQTAFERAQRGLKEMGV